MLYDPQLNLAFIHIPKNAGQSVRNALLLRGNLSYAALATDLRISEADAEHLMEAALDCVPDHAPLQPEHIPLAFLEMYFPASWDTLTSARSFILARHPRDRFFSALLQRLREYRGLVAIRADDPIVVEEARNVCDWLDGRGVFCDKEYIHFARQTDFAELRGKRIVSAVFPIDRIDRAEAWILRETGVSIAIAHDHARREPRKWAAGIQPVARFIGRHLLTTGIKKAIYPLWMNSGAFANAAARYQDIRLGKDLERFIEDYYACDLALYEESLGDDASDPSRKAA